MANLLELLGTAITDPAGDLAQSLVQPPSISTPTVRAMDLGNQSAPSPTGVDAMSLLATIDPNAAQPQPGAAPTKDKKKSGKLLDVLSTISGVASALSPMLFGKDSGFDVGELMNPIIGQLQAKKTKEGLMELLSSSPEMAGMIGEVDDIANQGGIASIIQAMSPDQANKAGAMAVMSKAQQRPQTAQQQIAQKLGIDFKKEQLSRLQDEPTYEQKQQIRFQEKRDNEIAKEQRRIKNREIKQVSPDIRKEVRNISEVERQYSLILETFNQPNVQAEFKEGLGNDVKRAMLTKGTRSELARQQLQKVSPALFQLAQQTEQALQKYGKQISGVAISAQEFERLRKALFSVMDQPQEFTRRLENLQVLNRYAMFDTLSQDRFADVYGASGGKVTKKDLDRYLKFVQVKNKSKRSEAEEKALKGFRKKYGLDFGFSY